MARFERVAGLGMVERLHAFLAPPDESEVAPVVLDVAALAGGVHGAGVETLAGRDATREHLVTGETEVPIDPSSRAVTAETLVATVEFPVRRRQFTRRDLPLGRLGKPGDQSAEDRGSEEAPGESLQRPTQP